MSATHLFTLEPAGAFRPGAGEPEAASGVLFHSDTLMAALQCTAAETGILAESALAASPRFSVSSIFFQVDGVRLYPRPLAAPPALESPSGSGEAERLRLWNGLDLVTEARLESLAEGRRVRLEAEDVIGGRAWGMPSERGLRGLPGGAPDGAAGSAGAATIGASEPTGDGKVFFLARLDEPGLLAPLKELTARLGESGLGGRSAGRGQFELAGAHGAPGFLSAGGPGGAEPVREPEPESEPAAALLLSLYLPSAEEVGRGVLRGAAAEVKVREGWIHSGGPTGLRKRPLRMLREGSVLRDGRPAGEMRDVRPEGFDRHPVWRDGRAFAIAYRGTS